jgi:hypothetical protein
MKLIHRHRSRQRGLARRVAISQAEITADLHYRGGSRLAAQQSGAARRSGR